MPVSVCSLVFVIQKWKNLNIKGLSSNKLVLLGLSTSLFITIMFIIFVITKALYDYHRSMASHNI